MHAAWHIQTTERGTWRVSYLNLDTNQTLECGEVEVLSGLWEFMTDCGSGRSEAVYADGVYKCNILPRYREVRVPHNGFVTGLA